MSNEKEQKSGLSAGLKVLGVVRTIIVYLVAIAIVAAAIIFTMDKSPKKSLFGYRYYTVLTPSMEKTYYVGDIVVVKLANADQISVDDVITFNPSSDTNTYLTHRVTQKLENYEGSGVTCFKTKGDANKDEDGFLIDSKRVIGKVVFSVPKIGYAIRFVQLRWYFVIPLAVMLIVLLELLKVFFADDDEEDGEDEKETSDDSDAKAENA